MPKFVGTIYVGNTGLKVADTNESHFVTLKPGSNVTADRTLTLTTGDGDRTMDMSSGSMTVSTFGASLIDDADASAARTTLGLGTLATQSGTFSGTSSGTNTGDQTLYNQTVEDEGTPVTQRGTINFTGAGVSVADTGGKTTVTIAGGGAADHGDLSGLGDDDHTQYLLVAGTRALIADWDAGSFEIRAQTFESDVTTGTAPFVVASTTAVANLNADLLDGSHAAAFQGADATLTALASYNTNGILCQTAADTFAGRTLTAPAAGITVTNGGGVAGNPTLALADDLAALEALAGTDTIYYRSGASTWTAVTIGANLTFSAGTLAASGGGLSDGDKGDITVTASGATWTIDDGVVTPAKMANGSAVSVLGRDTNSVGVRADIAATPGAGPAVLAFNEDDDTVQWSNGIGVVHSDGAGITYTGDPGADRIVFWDESANSIAYLTAGSGLSITGTTLSATGGAGVNKGTATLNFGAFPGATDATVAVTGQTGILSDSVVVVQLRPVATADHTADEHVVEEMDVLSSDIVAATGFTIRGKTRNHRLYGQWTVGYMWG